MRLYVLGPAFGLPSIDAEGNAAVALSKFYCDTTGERLELALTQGDGSPVLEHAGQTYTGLFAIKGHCFDNSILTHAQNAQAIALTSLLESQGQELLDVYHYVSSDNYRLNVRPAYTAILPWYANYIIPPSRRSAALQRTDHLGLSSLDVDDVHGDVLDHSTSLHGVASAQRGLFGGRTRTDYKTECARAFRLKGLLDALLEPLDAELGEKRFLLDTSGPSAVDCVAFGYLSLLLYPEMSQDWAAVAIRTRYPRIAQYIDRVADDLGMRSAMPWSQDRKWSSGQVFQLCKTDVLSKVPLLGQLITTTELERTTKQSKVNQVLRYILPCTSAAFALASYLLVRRRTLPIGEHLHVLLAKPITR